MQRSILDEAWVINSMDLGHWYNMDHRGHKYHAGVLISMQDRNSGDNHNMENNRGLSRVKPANQDSIKNLEKVRIEEADHQSSECSICLETFSFGSEAICMSHPCSHVFHHHCITRWLNISNTSPLCHRAI